MRTYSQYASVDGTGSNITNVVIQKNGRIRSIRWSVAANMEADADLVVLQLSTSSTTSLATEAPSNVLDVVAVQNNFVTSGMQAHGINIQRLMDYPIAAGEKIHLHALVTAATAEVYFFIDVEER